MLFIIPLVPLRYKQKKQKTSGRYEKTTKPRMTLWCPDLFFDQLNRITVVLVEAHFDAVRLFNRINRQWHVFIVQLRFDELFPIVIGNIAGTVDFVISIRIVGNQFRRYHLLIFHIITVVPHPAAFRHTAGGSEIASVPPSVSAATPAR